jgi:hypothetical protein
MIMATTRQEGRRIAHDNIRPGLLHLPECKNNIFSVASSVQYMAEVRIRPPWRIAHDSRVLRHLQRA